MYIIRRRDKMKIKSLLLSTATAVIIPAVGFAGPALASSPGQIDGGDIYRVKNVTQNTDYASTATAKTCEEVQYKVLLHNSGFGSVTNIVASANLPSAGGASNMTVTYDSNGPKTSVSGSATLNLTSAQSVSYESGTTQVLDKDGKLVKSLPDGVTNGGVNAGTLAGSTAEFVTFKAKTNCPTPPPPPPSCKTDTKLCPPPVTPPSTPPATPSTPAPTTLVNTGPGETAALFAVAVIAGTFGYRKYLSRKLSRQS